jgi:hypothetical protein
VTTSRPRAAAPPPTVVAADNPADDQRGAPATATRDIAAPDVGAQVSVRTSNSNIDELTFRWSAPVGSFADPTASQTRFFCPETPQRVDLTVVVTDAKGAVASDTVTVHCVASTR